MESVPFKVLHWESHTLLLVIHFGFQCSLQSPLPGLPSAYLSYSFQSSQQSEISVLVVVLAFSKPEIWRNQIQIVGWREMIYLPKIMCTMGRCNIIFNLTLWHHTVDRETPKEKEPILTCTVRPSLNGYQVTQSYTNNFWDFKNGWRLSGHLISGISLPTEKP